MDYKLINTYDELLHNVKQNSQSNTIIFKDLDIKFKIDFKLFFSKYFKELYDKKINIDNIICQGLDFIEFCVKNPIIIKNSLLTNVYISSSSFYIFSLLNVSFNKLNIYETHFTDEVNIDSTRKYKVNNITIENSTFEKNVVFSNILMNNAMFSILGNQTLFNKNLLIRDCFTINSTIDIRCVINENLKFLYLNQINDENVDLNYYSGNLYLHCAEIRNSLVLFKCKIYIVDISISIIKNIEENDFQCKVLKNDAPTLLRLAAINHGNIAREIHYTAEGYDRLLKEESIIIVKQLLSILESKPKIIKIKQEKINNWCYLYVKEPMLLFLTSFFSQNRLLLWLNKYSNDYGRSWGRGVFFTCCFTFIFYFIINYLGCEHQIFVIDFKFNNFNKVCDGFLYLIDIFNLSEIQSPFKLNTLGKYLLLFSRIVIAYGVWQTIYAFYKYRK